MENLSKPKEPEGEFKSVDSALLSGKFDIIPELHHPAGADRYNAHRILDKQLPAACYQKAQQPQTVLCSWNFDI